VEVVLFFSSTSAAGENLLVIVFGHALSITLVLQLVTTAIVLGLYALSQSMQEQKAKLASDRNMVFLVAFLVKHHPTIRSLDEFGDLTAGSLAKSYSEWKFFARAVNNLMEGCALPEPDPSAKTSLLGYFGSLVYVAVFALPSSIGLLQRPTFTNSYQLFHTSVRKNVVSRSMVVLSANVFLGFLVAELLLKQHPILCVILLLIPFFAVLQSVIIFIRITQEQQSWKEYWSDRMMEIMAAASRDDNHDLFNRALFLKKDVDSQPDLPIPGELSLYTTVFSVVQVTILFFSHALHLS